MAGSTEYRHVGPQFEAATVGTLGAVRIFFGQGVLPRRQHHRRAVVGGIVDGVVELLDVGDRDDGTGGRGGDRGKRGGCNEWCDHGSSSKSRREYYRTRRG